MQHLIYYGLMITTAVVIWFQTVAPVRFADLLDKYTWAFYLIGLFTSVLYIESCKIGAVIFDNSWAIRFNSFAINTFIFGICTYAFMNIGLGTKNIICLLLSIVILSIQCFWK